MQRRVCPAIQTRLVEFTSRWEGTEKHFLKAEIYTAELRCLIYVAATIKQ